MSDPGLRLRNAIVTGNLPTTKRLLHRFPELWLNVDSSNGWNNLDYSAFHGNYLICFHLISFVNQNRSKYDGLESVLQNHSDMLTFDRRAPLHLAILNHHLQTLHYLVQEFPGKLWLNHKGGKYEQTPIHYCAVYGFTEGLKLLMEYGADYEAVDINGNNVLHLGLQYGNIDCVTTFVELVYDSAREKSANIKKIKLLESTKNAHGWLPVELSLDFGLTDVYKRFKRKLLNKDLSSSSSQADLSSFTNQPPQEPPALRIETNIDEHKVLASPIIPVNELPASQASPQRPPARRTHSQSLPTSLPPDSKTLRSRANTTSIDFQPPPALSPATPTMRKTPSLKFITISPSVRSHPENDVVEADNSSSTSSTFSTSSPMHFATNRRASSSRSIPLDEESSLQGRGSPVVSSPSSIAAKLAFNSSRSTLSRRNSNDVAGHNGNSPMKNIRLNSSSSLSNINSAELGPASARDATASTPWSSSGGSADTKKPPIRSISFSRIR